VAFDVGDHERADRQDLKAAVADVVEREPDEIAADALALVGSRNLRVQQRDEPGLLASVLSLKRSSGGISTPLRAAARGASSSGPGAREPGRSSPLGR
jgi:hypothetical protein